MKTTRMLAGCALAMCFAGSALAATNVQVNVNLGNAPPPPVLVVQHAPRTVWMPEQRVYVASDRDFDDDYFQCGAFWYVYHANWWYRARTWRGPYAVIDYRDVPQSVVVVPARHWKHHYAGMPPGWGRHDRRNVVYVENRRPVVVKERHPVVVKESHPVVVKESHPVVVKERRRENAHDNDKGKSHGKSNDKARDKAQDRKHD